MKNPLIAKFQSLGNDLYWDVYVCSPELEKLSWVGYNDNHWWANVATKPGHNQRTDKLGHVWELNYRTNEVKLIS